MSTQLLIKALLQMFDLNCTVIRFIDIGIGWIPQSSYKQNISFKTYKALQNTQHR